MRLEVRFSLEAEEDLDRLFEFLLERAETVEDLELAESAIAAVRSAVMNQLSTTPYSFRKSGNSPTRREPIIPFGANGYVALYEIASVGAMSEVGPRRISLHSAGDRPRAPRTPARDPP